MSSKPGAGEDARTNRDVPADKKNDVVRTESDGGSKRLIGLVDFRRDILLALAYSGPTHGQGLVDVLGSLRSEKTNDGRFYPNLNALVDGGLVEKRENEHDNRSHEYALSNRGREAVREHARRVVGAVEVIDGGAR